MTNQQTIDAILHKIRHAPGNEWLLELSFGCLIEDNDRVSLQRVIYGPNGNDEIKLDGGAWMDDLADGSYIKPLEQPEKYKIIGHPVQWSHVLVAIGDRYAINGGSSNNQCVWKYNLATRWQLVDGLTLNLTLTPEQAMHNDPQLVTFLAEVLNVKE